MYFVYGLIFIAIIYLIVTLVYLKREIDLFSKLLIILVFLFIILKVCFNILNFLSKEEFLLLLFFDLFSFCFYFIGNFMKSQMLSDLKRQNLISVKSESMFVSATDFFNTYLVNISILSLQIYLIFSSPFL